MPAAATRAAAAGGEIVQRRHSAQFEGFRHELKDGFADLVDLLLGVEEVLGHRILQEALAVALELGNFLAIEWQPELLLLVERVALLDDELVLALGLLI